MSTTFKENLPTVFEKPGSEGEYYKNLEAFTKWLSELPDAEFVKPTPDGKAVSLVISAMEASLDEIYLGQWGYTEPKFTVVFNEIVCTLQFWAIHPLTKNTIERGGCAAIAIMMNKQPAKADGTFAIPPSEWAQDIAANKKSNALKLNIPAVKSLALKNAVESLGNVFGRNLNRKFRDTPDDFYSDEFEKQQNERDAARKRQDEIDEFAEKVRNYTDTEKLLEFAKTEERFGKDPDFRKHIVARHTELTQQNQPTK